MTAFGGMCLKPIILAAPYIHDAILSTKKLSKMFPSVNGGRVALLLFRFIVSIATFLLECFLDHLDFYQSLQQPRGSCSELFETKIPVFISLRPHFQEIRALDIPGTLIFILTTYKRT